MVRCLAGDDEMTYGLRFHAGENGAYELIVTGDTFQLIREAEDGTVVSVIPETGRAELGRDRAAELRAVVRNNQITVYIGGTLSWRGTDHRSIGAQVRSCSMNSG